MGESLDTRLTDEIKTKFSSKVSFPSNQAFGGVTVKQGTVK